MAAQTNVTPVPNSSTYTADLGQSQYNFNYLTFPSDIGNTDLSHYMIININVPVRVSGGSAQPVGSFGQSGLFDVLPNDLSKIDTLRFGSTGAIGAQTPTLSAPRFTRRIAQSIALHMPSPMIFTDENKYENISLTALGRQLLVGGIEATLGAAGAALGNPELGALAGGVFGGVAGKLTDPTGIVGRGLQVFQTPINPAVEVLFANKIQRAFTFELLLAPRNEQESKAIFSIIKTIRFHGSPEINPAIGLLWIPPAEFDITFFAKGVENQNILRINTCALERIEVDEAPAGVYSTFSNGYPVALRVVLSFRELEPISKNRILQGF